MSGGYVVKWEVEEIDIGGFIREQFNYRGRGGFIEALSRLIDIREFRDSYARDRVKQKVKQGV